MKPTCSSKPVTLDFTDPIEIAKAEIRRSMRRFLGEITAVTRCRASAQVVCRVQELEAWQSAQSILFYSPIQWELDIKPLIHLVLKAGRSVCLPSVDPASNSYLTRQIQCLETDLVMGQYNILEPSVNCPVIPTSTLDFALVPGIAFGRSGERLGRGKGYYDRLLSGFRGVTCGVCYEEQILSSLPMTPHDRRVNWVVTPDLIFGGCHSVHHDR